MYRTVLYGDRGILIFPVQLTTSRICNLTRLINTLLPGISDDHTYLHTVLYCSLFSIDTKVLVLVYCTVRFGLVSRRKHMSVILGENISKLKVY